MKASTTAASMLLASALVLPTLAASIPVDMQMESRDVSVDNVEAREPFFFLAKIAAKIGKKVVGAVAHHKHRRDFDDAEELSTRDVDDLAEFFAREELAQLNELEAREPFFFLAKAAAKIGKKVVGAIAHHKHRRDLEDVEELSTREVEELADFYAREELDQLTDVEAREPFFFLAKAAAKIGKKVVGAIAHHKHRRDLDDMEELSERDVEELAEFFAREELGDLTDVEAREPFFFLAKIAAKVGKKVVGAIAHHKHRRDLEDVEDLLERDMELDELD